MITIQLTKNELAAIRELLDNKIELTETKIAQAEATGTQSSYDAASNELGDLEELALAFADVSNFTPLNADGSVDTASQVDLNDASDEWTAALSDADAAIVNKINRS